MLNIEKRYTKCTISNRGGVQPEWIVIHYFGGLSTALECADWFCNPCNRSGSADFCVDDEHIIQVNPNLDKYNTWHCGGGLQGNIRHAYHGICKNCNSIGIEMRPYNDHGNVIAAKNAGWYFHQQTVDNTIDLVRYLMSKYNIDTEHVIMHADVTGKYCPAPFLDDISQWENFKKRISLSTSESEVPENMDFRPYIITVTADALHVRKLPSTASDIVMTIHSGEKYTIVQESADSQWGCLKSGAGWIYLPYTDKSVNAMATPDNITASTTPFIVEITASVLNVRQGPGTEYPIIMTVARGERYTILEVINGFGRLKSGAGFISMEYTNRI